ncbi:hypothetical protein [Haloarchaeobius sp. HME9146]|uniref:hypothetical protein n=1 Tax=Haloarchaeobius sp. HME9146 TaxID=2978732 RepID=UPI0021BFD25D|nr:hypothetical protein [Haloarchaeobius sp. HME9146]MCT9097042.1 hypothetical protein [Haloarchaeobius sp. HME9146]
MNHSITTQGIARNQLTTGLLRGAAFAVGLALVVAVLVTVASLFPGAGILLALLAWTVLLGLLVGLPVFAVTLVGESL